MARPQNASLALDTELEVINLDINTVMNTQHLSTKPSLTFGLDRFQKLPIIDQ